MALILARQKRGQEIQDRQETRAYNRRDLVRLYADPLFRAVQDLRYRLDEIFRTGQAKYLLVKAPKNHFVEYKKISTYYRVAALLGWIRAFRRERSYLDPDQGVAQDPTDEAIERIVRALADGQHVEAQRLDELLNLWRVPKNALVDSVAYARIASEIDGVLQEFLDDKVTLSASDLPAQQKMELVSRCAGVLRLASIEVPVGFLESYVEQASAVLGIKEAYIYRDWQSAIGDTMIVGVTGAPRRFEVIGFGEFEDRYLKSRASDGSQFDRRWLDRLEALFHNLDMQMTGIFDARRQQLRTLHEDLGALELHLREKRTELSAVGVAPEASKTTFGVR